VHVHPRPEKKNGGEGVQMYIQGKVVSAPLGRARVDFLGNRGDLDDGSG